MIAVQTPWYTARDGVTQGPLSHEDLVAMARDGRLRKDDHVWNPDMTGWIPAFQQADLFPASSAPAALAPPQLPARMGFDFGAPDAAPSGGPPADASATIAFHAASAEPAITFFPDSASAAASPAGASPWSRPAGSQAQALPAMTISQAETIQLPSSKSNDIIALAPHPAPAAAQPAMQPQPQSQPQRPRPAAPLAGAARPGVAAPGARTGPSTSRASAPSAPAIDPDIEKDVKNAVVAACISGGITALFAMIAMTGAKLAGIGAEAFVDVALVFGLAFGVSRKSRACAVILVVYFIASKVYMMSTMGKPTGVPLALVFAYYYAKGVQATFRYHAARNGV